MSPTLLKWIGDADSLRHMDRFKVRDIPLDLGYQRTRKDDLYIALVGELFDRMRDGEASPTDWAHLGNAIAQYAAPDRTQELLSIGISRTEATLYASGAFYFGGFPASAYLTAKNLIGAPLPEAERACAELLARPLEINSRVIRSIKAALIRGDLEALGRFEEQAADAATAALEIGPDDWIPKRLLQSLLNRFSTTNLRAVLPNGGTPFWTQFVASMVGRGTWDFFPSQVAAIERGLLARTETFSLQMPTGAGKTTLCETLLFHHLRTRPNDAAVLLVPYRSLASELRGSLVKHLNEMDISARCAYGGTVPSGEEVRNFDNTRALVATPETLSGILSANTQFAARISLVICDEGHLLDAPSRGVGLELLLARMKIRQAQPQRYVFVSAIVPNIEEINQWLGGTDETVIRSTYRPAIAEFAVLRPVGQGANRSWDLEMHPHEAEPFRYRIDQFIRREDFQFLNEQTGNRNTYSFNSYSCRAIAAARKALPMGAVVVFAANKRGDQGAIGLAEQLLRQTTQELTLPNPADFADDNFLVPAIEYLNNEYGADWVGTQSLRAGVVLHHGDIPQETREVLEQLLRQGAVSFGICTSTLAEGVNLPIRTLVLYSVQRVGAGGARENLLTRDIKNLVGRAGRAGSTTKGLVICVNPDQWHMVAAVAQQAAGEPVVGALRSLVENVRRQLAANDIELTNELLENSSVVHSLIDGVDATLIDLAAIEIGEEELIRMATEIADQTFAARQTDEASKQVLRSVFRLRAQRIIQLQNAGRTGWLRETGTRLRMLPLVENGLLLSRARWDDIASPEDPTFIDPLLKWAWGLSDIQEAAREAFRVPDQIDVNTVRDSFDLVVKIWISGEPFAQIAQKAAFSVDDLLGVYTKVISFSLQTIVEQGLAILEKLLNEAGHSVAPTVLRFSEHFRFGVPTVTGCILASGGVTHRKAFVEIGKALEPSGMRVDDRDQVFDAAQNLMEVQRDQWRENLGTLVFERTLRDLSAVTRRPVAEE